jgi:hypothetical protein
VTLARKYHVIAITLIVLGIAAGASSWALSGVPFWVVTGVGLAFVVIGLVFGGLAGAEERKRQQDLE